MLTCERCGCETEVRFDNGHRAICPDCYSEVYCRGRTTHYGDWGWVREMREVIHV